MALGFEWDPKKDRANQRKHGVGFDEARSVFFDEGALVAPDPEHSRDEDRFLIVGFSVRARLLPVCFCERERGNVIRIFSARSATKRERTQYRQGRLS